MTRRPTPPAPFLALVALATLAAGPARTASTGDTTTAPAQDALRLNELEYLEMPGLNVMLAHDYYPEGHQGGVGIIQNGLRVATNGDIRLDRTPGQWQPVPKVGKRVVDRATGEISVRAEFPDEAQEPQGLQPGRVPGPALRLHACACGRRARLSGSWWTSSRPLPDEWVGQGRLQPGAVPRDPLRQVLRDRDADGHLPAPAERAGDARREGGVPDRAARHGKAARHRPRVGEPADGDRGREGRRPRARRRPRPAQQRLVRRALARREGRDHGGRGLARDAPRDPGLHRSPHRPGLAGRVPPEAAEVGHRGAGPARRAPAAGRPLAGHGDGRSREGDGGAPAELGPLPPLRLPPPRLHVGRDAGDVRGELRRRALEPVPHRQGRLPAPRLAADRRLLPAHSDVSREGERALPRVARRLPPRRRPHGAR